MEETKWVKLVERESDFWKNYMFISSVGYMGQVFGCSIQHRLTTRRGMKFTQWTDPEDTRKVSLQIESVIKDHPSFIGKVRKVFEKDRKRLLKISRYLEKTDLGKVSDKKLLNLYDRFCDAYKLLYPSFNLSLHTETCEVKTTAWLKQALKENTSQFDEIYARLSVWPEYTLIQEEELALFKISHLLKNNRLSDTKKDKLLKLHTFLFGGLPVISDEVKSWDESHFLKKLEELSNYSSNEIREKISTLEKYSKKVKKDKTELIKKLQMSEDIAYLFEYISLATWIRLTARNTFAISHHLSKKLFGEIGRRRNLTSEDVKWLQPEEVHHLMIKGEFLSKKKLNKRMSASFLLFKDGIFTITEGEEAEGLIEKVEQRDHSSNNKQIKGAVAFNGTVSGKAKIIISQKDIQKFNKDDILVTRMTTVELLPIIKLAKGIITDEGGITSHAAIISREFKIPCITGTKNGTKIIKDNDTVTLNGETGEVILTI